MSISRIIALTALLACTLSMAAPSRGEDGQSGATREFERIKREMREKKKELKRAGRRERSILAELESLDRDIQAGSAELAIQQRRLQEAEAALREIEQSSAEIGRELAKQKSLYALRLRALYKMRRSGAAFVATPDNLGGLAKRIKYFGLIAERDQELIRDYGLTLDRFALQQAGIAEKKADILDRRKTVEARKAELETARLRKSAILANVRRTKTVYEDTLHELEEASAGLWALIKKDERERRSAKDANEPAGRGVDEKSKLMWPLEGPVLTRFGKQRHPQFGTMVFRSGIEIEAREGQEVRAADGGQAAYADWYKGHGKLVILDHGNGLYTLYGNLSKLDLGKGERVAKGQVIGRAGETGSMKGSKLYFEIRRNGEAQDPIGWLAKR
jgi:septal ring factor EnvC (AmiA/AmiB activator)